MKLEALYGFFALVLLATPSPTPRPAGPGGVYDAAVSFLDALAAGEAHDLERAFVGSRHGIEFTPVDGSVDRTSEPETPFDFYDVGADGKSWTAHTAEDLVASRQRAEDSKLGRPRVLVTRAYADCPSGDCSFVVVEFDRIWGQGKTRRTVSMRATALMRWTGGEGPAFKLFHWHATQR